MANYANLLATIAANIYTNGNQEVTAAMVKSAVDAMVGSLGYGYQFRGAAAPSDNPGTPDQRVYYVAKSNGIYTNFGGISVSEDEIAILKWDSAWSKEVLTINAISTIAPRLAQQDAEIASFEQVIRELVENYPNVTIYGNVTNNPNNEDINTNENDQLQFADRGTLYGKGYKILRKNKTFSEQVTDVDTIYEIRYDFDLGGASVTIPLGSVLRFLGGSVNNGTIVGNNTQIIGELSGVFGDIVFSGDWNVPIIKSNFLRSGDVNSLIGLLNENIQNDFIIEDGDYIVSKSGQYFGAAFWLKSNTRLVINGTLRLAASDDPYASVVQCYGVDNVEICGSGNIIGDRDSHIGATGEWGHGIAIYQSKNISIHDLHISKCWGDSISVTSASAQQGASKNVIIENCELFQSRRQGISIGHAHFVQVNSCYIHDISGTNPQRGIDIEPDEATADAKHIWINNTYIENCVGGIDAMSIHSTGAVKDVKISGCRVVSTSSPALRLRGVDVSVEDSYFESTASSAIIDAMEAGAKLTLDNCSIISGYANCTYIITDDSNLVVNIQDSKISCPSAYLATYLNNADIKNCDIIMDSLWRYGTLINTSISSCKVQGYLSGKMIDVFLVENTFIFDNISGIGIFLGNDSDRIKINGNTFSRNAETDLSFLFYIGSGAKNIDISNNILNQSGTGKFTTSVYAASVSPLRISGNIITGTDAGSWIINGTACFSDNGYATNRGTTSQRPTLTSRMADIGFMYYDTSIKKPIFWDGTGWKDSSGNSV